MHRVGPIIIIEDDPDDQEILEMVFKKLDIKNELIFFADGELALAYLQHPAIVPFLILSDINLPKLDGLKLRAKLKTDTDLAVKCIPYLFFSTALSQQSIINAYSQSAQGFFVKGTSFQEIEQTISIIMAYWVKCAAPNNFI